MLRALLFVLAPGVAACGGSHAHVHPPRIAVAAAPAHLRQAVVDGDVPRVERLVKGGLDPNTRDAAGASMLHVACGLGQREVARALIELGASVHVLDAAMGVTPLHRAAQGGDPGIVKLLLSRGAFIDDQSAVNGHTPLLDAMFYKQYAVVELLLGADANTSLKNTLGLSPMDWAVRQQDARLKRLLEEQGARDARRSAAQALIKACRDNDVSRVQELISGGSDVNQVAKDGNTPLLIAAKLGRVEIVKLLLDHGADPNKVDKLMKATPGHKAAFFGHAPVLRLLIKHGLKVDAVGPYNGYTALHDALLNSHVEASKVLLRAGASVTIEGVDGKTPRSIAQERGLGSLLDQAGGPGGE